MYRLLIVDDEPNLVEGLYEYLISVVPEETDILKAYSGREAFQIMRKYSVDLLIADIQMPGMTGLELISKVEQIRPRCSIIFLTGYNNFEWIQNALRHPCCVDYVLKTEGDQVIGEAVLRQLNKIEMMFEGEELLRRAAVQMDEMKPFFDQKEMYEWLEEGKKAPDVTVGGIHTKEKVLLCMCRCKSIQKLDRYYPLLKKLLEVEFQNSAIEVVKIGWGEHLILIQTDEESFSDSVYRYLYIRMEKVQTLLRNAGFSTDVALFDAWADLSDIRKNIIKMHKKLFVEENAEKEMLVRIGEVSATQNDSKDILKWIKRYVKDNISNPDITLTMIAEKTCYAPGYLSRLFKEKEGMNFLVYVAEVRIDTACRLFKEGRYNAKQVSRMVGFESPSYFSAFFKRKTGKTPLQYVREEAVGI